MLTGNKRHLFKARELSTCRKQKLLLAYDFVVGLMVLYESEEPDKNRRSMFGL